jgi:triacylglycerol lipase
MELDSSWDALSNPGLAKDYFNLPAPTPLQSDTNKFSSSNAWWLAEICRLCYHPDYHHKQNINFGCFKYKKIASIDNIKTSTHVSLLKVTGIDNGGNPNNSLVIAFRGTDDLNDWNSNLQTIQRPYGSAGKVHSGFKDTYLSIRDELLGYLDNNSLPIFVTGHSLGAALATLTVSDIYKNINFDSCYTFGSPRTGNNDFVNAIENDNFYRVVNNCDIVTVVPLDFAVIKYRHIGNPILINDEGHLSERMNDDEVYTYQKSKVHQLKEYAVSQFLSKKIKHIKNKLPRFLSDHAPLNYVIALQNLIED